MSLTVNGFARTVVVHVPQGSTNSTPLALVLNLHGASSTAVGQEELTNMDATADANHFIVAYPQALIPDGTGFEWNVPGYPLYGGTQVPANAADDVKFLTALPRILERMYCVNTSAVYATGFSGGAREVSQLACEASNVFAAVAPVAGVRRPTPCPTRRAVSVIAFHGSADTVNPFAGHGQKYWTYSVSTAARYWAQQDHCSTKANTTSPLPNVTLVSYSRCSSGAVVRLYEVMGDGHDWPVIQAVPSTVTTQVGSQSNVTSVNTLMWSFFHAHRLR